MLARRHTERREVRNHHPPPPPPRGDNRTIVPSPPFCSHDFGQTCTHNRCDFFQAAGLGLELQVVMWESGALTILPLAGPKIFTSV